MLAGLKRIAFSMQLFERALAVRQDLYANNREDTFVSSRLVGAYVVLAWLQEQRSDPEGAARRYREGIALAASMPHVNTGSDWDDLLGRLYGGYGLLLWGRRRAKPASKGSKGPSRGGGAIGVSWLARWHRLPCILAGSRPPKQQSGAFRLPSHPRVHYNSSGSGERRRPA